MTITIISLIINDNIQVGLSKKAIIITSFDMKITKVDYVTRVATGLRLDTSKLTIVIIIIIVIVIVIITIVLTSKLS